MRKIISLVGVVSLLLGSISLPIVSANSYESTFGSDYVKSGSQYYEQGISGAKWYMDLQKNDDYWVGKKPKLENYGILYHADDDVNPAYIEYKISCGKDDCGSVIVNLDGTDVRVPEGATFGKSNYENLQNGASSKKSHLYRFGLLEQYIVGDTTLDVKSLDPKEINPSYDKINSFKKKMSDYKQTPAYKQRISSNTVTQTNMLAGSISPLSTTATNVYVPGASTANCPSRTPCYGQFTDTYNGSTCTLGCSPNAMAIIYGYYDRQGTFPNLVTGTAIDISYVKNSAGTVIFPLDANIRTMSNSIRSSMGTQCFSGLGGTTQSNIQLGVAYAKGKGYNGSTSSYVATGISPASIIQALKIEVNAGRPMIIHSNGTNSGHSFVAYGYSSDTTSTMVRVNYGGASAGDLSYFGKDIDLSQAVPAIVGGGTFNAYTKLTVSN